MSKELVTISANALPALVSMDIFKEVAQAGSFLQRIQLYSKGRYVETGLISPGHYGIPVSEDTVEDLGLEIDVLPLVWRPKAIDMTDQDAIIVNYDNNSNEYKRIKETADNVQNSHCMYGPTFLVFERKTGKLYELFFGNPSMRRESGRFVSFCPISPEMAVGISKQTGKEVEPRGPLPCTLKAKYVTKSQYGWHVPVVHQCSQPFTNLPAIEVLVEEVNKFYALKNSEVEKVKEPGSKRAR